MLSQIKQSEMCRRRLRKVARKRCLGGGGCSVRPTFTSMAATELQLSFFEATERAGVQAGVPGPVPCRGAWWGILPHVTARSSLQVWTAWPGFCRPSRAIDATKPTAREGWPWTGSSIVRDLNDKTHVIPQQNTQHAPRSGFIENESCSSFLRNSILDW
jgi:hypothetical protein